VNRKYVWIGITVLVSLCLLVSVGSATKTTLKEGDVELAISGTTYADAPYDSMGTSGTWEIRIDADLKNQIYPSYSIEKTIFTNKTGVEWEDIPEIVIQPISMWRGATYNIFVGTGQLKLIKGGYIGSNKGYVDFIFYLDIDGEYQSGILVTETSTIFDEDKDPDFTQIAQYYKINWFEQGVAPGGYAADIATTHGISILLSNGARAISSNVSDGVGITAQKEFYNEYEIFFVEQGLASYKGINITRVCPGCSGKNTKSLFIILDEYGNLIYESDWEVETNETWHFEAAPVTIFLCAFGMESDSSHKCVLIYDEVGGDVPYCSVKGYTYNAETGAVLSNVSTSIDGRSDMSNEDGFYFIGPILAESYYDLQGSKSGYHDRLYEDLYLPYEQDYLIDLPLIPEYPTHTGHGILGTVTTLPYHGICENHTVSIENSTWGDTTTTNSVGYYIFDNLEVDDYWINVSKDGYRDNNQSVTVSVTGDEIVTIDACDATTKWDSDNTLAVNTTDKQEGTGSLQSSGSNTLDFNKSASSAIDASNVTKENGYMAFWYKINDTTRITDYLVFTVGSNGDNTTDKISWSVHKANFVNDTWKEVWLKFSDGTETGTLNMSNVNWIEVKAAKSDTVISKIDNIRFYDFSYEIHNVDLDPILSLGVIAKTTNEEIIASFIATLDSTSLNTTSGEELVFTDLHYGMHELTVTSEGYFPYQRSIYLDSNTNITAYMQEGAEGGAGVYYPPPHLVEFRVVDVWGIPLSDITVNATGYETTVVNLTWFQKLFGFNEEVEVYNSTMEGTTDSIGHISFFMVETIKYKMWFTNASQNISAYREIYPKDERYTITIGEIPTQKIAYWITSEQNDTANTGNVTLHYSDYNSPVKTNWVNFSIYYLDNDTLAYTYNFTTINETNENTSINLNASYSYKIKCIADHDDFGVFTWYVTVVFIMPEKPKLPVVQILKDSLEDWQLQTFSLFVIILFALIFGAYSSGVGGMVVSFTAIGFHLFGMMPLVPALAGAVVYPLIAVMAIINLLSEQKGSAEV